MAESQIQEKHAHIKGRSILDRIVLGGSDGVIESIAVTAGLNGAAVDFRTILLAGFAFAIAGALSMFFSSYLSRRAEIDTLRKDIERERLEIETEPEEERIELEDLLRKEGYKQKEVDVMIKRITKDKELWLRTQLTHELHVHAADVKSGPLGKSIPAGSAFFLGAVIPLAPYLITLPHTFALTISVALSLISLFSLGATKFVSLRQISIKSGLEMAAIGGGAAILLYGVGRILASL